MGKKTNDFQTLIATVYAQITPAGGKVTESGMVYDADGKTLREVDILVEFRYAHHTVKIVIECRDRSRKATIAWIDEIIGKTGSLLVDKRVAVSKTGFAKAAVTKAQKHGIDTLSLDEAVEEDWKKFPIKPGILLTSELNFRLDNIFFQYGSFYYPLDELNPNLFERVGHELVPLRPELENFFYSTLLPKLRDGLEQEALALCKTKDDIYKTAVVQYDWKTPGLMCITEKAEHLVVEGFRFIFSGMRYSADVPKDHMKFNDMMISYGRLSIGSELIFTSTITQDLEAVKMHVSYKIDVPA